MSSKLHDHTRHNTSLTVWDRVGIGLSGLCAIHCLFFPVLLSIIPLWPMGETLHIWLHPVFFVLIVPTVFLATKKNRDTPSILVFLYTGLALIGLAWIFHTQLGNIGETIVTLSGSSLLITGHWKNYKMHSYQHCAVHS